MYILFPRSIAATSNHPSPFPKIWDQFTHTPWWVYSIVAIIVVLIIFLLAQRRTRKNRKVITSEPITIQKPTFHITPGNAQTIGRRPEQQDAFGFSDIEDEDFIEQYGVLAVVADGMGGLLGGKEVSQIAVHSFLEHYLHSEKVQTIPERLLTALLNANDSVLHYSYEKSLTGNTGTTLIAAVIFKDQLFWLSIGDSRIFLKQEESLRQLTTDHIYAEELAEKVAIGKITMEEAENDPQKESLTSFLGLESLEKLDITMKPLPLNRGDSVILCSDGLYGSVTVQEILDVCNHLPAQEAAERLIEIAISKDHPYQDNATVAILTIE